MVFIANPARSFQNSWHGKTVREIVNEITLMARRLKHALKIYFFAISFFHFYAQSFVIVYLTLYELTKPRRDVIYCTVWWFF
jgi:hypothetical protein